MRLERSALIHYLNTTPESVSASWYKIGKDVEDMSVDLAASVEKAKNILDETSVRHTGYEASASVNTYYADPDDAFYSFIEGIALGRKKGDDCKTEILEVVVKDTEDSSHTAYKEDAIIEVQSYGGPQGGVSIPYTIHFSGNRVEGTVTFDSSKKPTFSPA